MKTVLMRLEGPLQSWGTQGRFGIRDTDREPSKSGVVGLVGAALGMKRDDLQMIGRLSALALGIRVDREGSVVRDYHTVGGGTFRGEPQGLWSVDAGKKQVTTALTERFYLSGASFLAALGGEDHELVDRIAKALSDPVWPLFLGRRSCPPSKPVFVGVREAPPDSCLRSERLEADLVKGAPERIRLVLESDAASGRPRNDLPLSFDMYARRFGLRHVRVEHIDRDALVEAT